MSTILDTSVRMMNQRMVGFDWFESHFQSPFNRQRIRDMESDNLWRKQVRDESEVHKVLKSIDTSNVSNEDLVNSVYS